ncbi:MAG: amidase family protein [Mycoplasma sp.]
MKNNISNKFNASLNSILEVNKSNPISLEQLKFSHIDNPNSPLNGMIYSLKDNIATKGIKTTGGSLFLANYIPEYDATVKTLLDQAGAVCISKDNLDEFGLGGTGIHSGFGFVKNAFDETRISGGSSSGSCVMVAKKLVDFSIGTDTGDSIRRPASLQGIYGFKPTYGRISRYGVYPYAPSLDHVGVLSNDIDTISKVMSVISHKDNNDMTSIETNENFLEEFKISKPKFAIIKETIDFMANEEKTLFLKHIETLKSKGIIIEEVSFPKTLLELVDPIYKTISYGEATTCWANLSGVLFGQSIDEKNFEEILKNNRTKFFGRQLKRRFVIGAFATCAENYFEIFQESKKVRTLIINQFDKLISNYDALIMPGASSIAPKIEDEVNHLKTSSLTDDALQIANFGGYPSLTIPAIKYNNLFVGLNLTCKLFEDRKALALGKILVEVLGE